MCLKSSLAFLMTLVLLCGPQIHTSALPTDKTQPFTAHADYASINQFKHRSEYRKNVSASQGTSQFKAEHLEIYTDIKNEVQLVLAYGHPASYQTLPKINELLFYAEADQITYYPLEQKIILQGHASAKRNNNQLTGDLIEYYPNLEEVHSKASKVDQTHVVLQTKN